MVQDYGKFLQSFNKNKHLKYGLPFVGLMLFGWYALRESQSVQYDFNKSVPLDREELAKKGFKVKKKAPTLEEVYESVKDLDIDNWENIRGPRLWDETSEN